MLQKAIPILRIFDVTKAKEFYIDWLDFKIEWEHQFEPNTPFYICISKDEIELHLQNIMAMLLPAVKFISPAPKLKNFSRNCNQDLTNTIARV